MLYAKLKDGTKIAAIGTPADRLVHLHVDTAENEDRDHPDLQFDMPVDEAKDLWLGLGHAIQDAGGSLT